MYNNTILLVSIILLAVFNAYGQEQTSHYILSSSTVTFTSSTLNQHLSSTNLKSTGKLNLDDSTLIVQVPIQSFLFQNKIMEKRFNENYLESNKYPEAFFEGKLIGRGDFSSSGIFDSCLIGKLNIHGISHEVSVAAVVKINEAYMEVSTEFNILLADYNIKLPVLATILDKLAEVISIDFKGKFYRFNPITTYE